MPGGHPFFTVGHSTRPLDEFLSLLSAHAIEVVVDVRKLPGSRRYPQYDEDALREELAGVGLRLARIEALTGRRPVSKTVPFQVNAWWRNRSFHNYADHALSPAFREALSELRELGAAHRAAIMCSEAVWWRCHRRIIGDHLLAHGDEVRHLMDETHAMPAELSDGAHVADDLAVTYPGDPPS